MQKPPGRWNIRRPGITYSYKENFQWNQKFRPQGKHFQGNFQNYDYQYWCETCDKGFATARFLENHKIQHQKCNIDGCQFVAHPKVITKHIQMQHSTGLFKKISKLNNPEEIKKWREERKKKYPTIENIKKKEAEMKEKINRGEKMGMQHERGKRNYKREFHHTNYRNSQTRRTTHYQGRNNGNITNNRKRRATDDFKKKEFPKKVCKIIPTIEESRTLKHFAGIQSLQNYDLDEEIDPVSQTSVPIEDDEDAHSDVDIDPIQTERNVPEPTVCSALTSLMGCYASSDEDDNDGDSNMQNQKLKYPLYENKAKGKDIRNNDNTSNQVKQSKITEKSYDLNFAIKANEYNKVEVSKSSVISNCQDVSDNESGPEEINISKEGTNLPIDDINIIKSKPGKGMLKEINRPSIKKHELIRKRNKLPSTLLEKLLHRDIQHERNIILQCVRYVVNNKYFDKK